MKAIVLFSGGLDSSVILAQAIEKGRSCIGIFFDYGQRHRVELESAKAIAKHYNIPLRILTLPKMTFAQSSLVYSLDVDKDHNILEKAAHEIPSSYVPARNLLFLSFAAGQAELEDAEEIYFGANAVDGPAYPDCQPEFFAHLQNTISCATKQSAEGRSPSIICPVLHMKKEEIVQEAMRLDVPIHLTWTCYDPGISKQPCELCLSCRQRAIGFQEANTPDPLITHLHNHLQR